MNAPDGYTVARRVAGGVVKLPARWVDGKELPELIVGHGDEAILKIGEVEESAGWEAVGKATPLPEQAPPGDDNNEGAPSGALGGSNATLGDDGGSD